MLDGLDETNSQQLLHFLHYLFFYFGMKYFGRLSHWLGLGIYIECMHYQSWVQPRHLTVVPYENILELFQQ